MYHVPEGLNGPKNNISTSSSFSILFIVKLRCDIIALSSPGNMSAGRAAVSLHTGASFSGHLVSVEPDVTCRYLLLTRHQPAAAAAPMLLSCKPENVIWKRQALQNCHWYRTGSRGQIRFGILHLRYLLRTNVHCDFIYRNSQLIVIVDKYTK